MQKDFAIGVFDSGVGGLTVLKALQSAMPHERFIYLGDTARVPYGSRSPETIIRYSKRVTGHLLQRDIKALVIACNTATTYALTALQEACQNLNLPVFGVIEPSATMAVHTSPSQHILVLGTEGTIAGGKYTETITRLSPNAKVSAKACPLFVPLIEEGWHGHMVTEMVAKEYFAEIQNLESIDTAILGCTHYPLIKSLLGTLFPSIHFIDSAETTAQIVRNELNERQILNDHLVANRDTLVENTLYLVTDNLPKFSQVGHQFIGHTPSPLELVDLTDQDEDFVDGLL